MPVLGLVDINSFYASAEQLFRPDLAGHPVVVLSNNDGCVVARSREAKALGIKMGQPYFENRDLVKRSNLDAFSSNYALYHDLSNRVMTTLETLAPRVAQYSIDEAFVDISDCLLLSTVEQHGQRIRDQVLKHTGMPVCVGFGPTKTLAKLANYAAKRYPATQGVVSLMDPARRRRLREITPVREVWGVGSRIGRRLIEMGIETAEDLAMARPSWLQAQFSVVLVRTARELNGEPCLEFEEDSNPKQQIMVSRSFGARVTGRDEMGAAVAAFASRAAEKLRGEGQLAGSVSVFIRTNVFNERQPQHSAGATLPLARPTDDTRVLLGCCRSLLDRVWRDGYSFAKAGVLLSDFRDPGALQEDLFAKGGDSRDRTLMGVVDAINARCPGGISFGTHSRRDRQGWTMSRDMLSPPFTTSWQHLPLVR